MDKQSKMIVGFGYKARSGKDEAARVLCERYGFARTAFAESLKAACQVIFQLDDRHWNGELKEVMHDFWATTPRDILQRVGTEAMRRGFDENIWVQSVYRRITRPGAPIRFIITDCRFPNEAEAIKHWGGKVYRIDRPAENDLSASEKSHASETAMDGYDGWDGVITNDGTIEELHDQVIRAIGLPPAGW